MTSLSDLAKRCVAISFKERLTHVSSVLNTVDILNSIYLTKDADDVVILGNGHAGLALYVVLEHWSEGKVNAEQLLKLYGIHPCRRPVDGITISSGSLGQAETIALGMALGFKGAKRKVYLVTSDGACMEGAVHEMARHWARLRSYRWFDNLIVYVIANGFGAYGEIRRHELPTEFHEYAIFPPLPDLPDWLRCQAGHYLTLSESQYAELMA